MQKTIVTLAAFGLFWLLAGPAFAGGYHSQGQRYGGGHQYHGAYQYHGGNAYRPSVYHGGYNYRAYAPPVYRHPVVVVPVHPPVVYRPVYPRCEYPEQHGGFYIQGRNFNFGIGY